MNVALLGWLFFTRFPMTNGDRVSSFCPERSHQTLTGFSLRPPERGTSAFPLCYQKSPSSSRIVCRKRKTEARQSRSYANRQWTPSLKIHLKARHASRCHNITGVAGAAALHSLSASLLLASLVSWSVGHRLARVQSLIIPHNGLQLHSTTLSPALYLRARHCCSSFISESHADTFTPFSNRRPGTKSNAISFIGCRKLLVQRESLLESSNNNHSDWSRCHKRAHLESDKADVSLFCPKPWMMPVFCTITDEEFFEGDCFQQLDQPGVVQVFTE